MKNTCDQCLECPSCGVALIKRYFDSYDKSTEKYSSRKYMYVCPYCYWDTSNIKFSCPKETDLDSLIYQLKDTSSKGYLKKMYDHTISKLKENEGLITDCNNFN